MGNFFEDIGFLSSSNETKTSSTISEEQRSGQNFIIEQMKEAFGNRGVGEQFPGPFSATADPAFNEAFNRFTKNQGGFKDLRNMTTRDLMSGRPAFEFDEKATTESFLTNFANPLLESFRNTTLSTLRETQNAPGSLYSRGTDEFLNRQTANFYDQTLAPRLHADLQFGRGLEAQSLENAAGRRQDALNIPFQDFSNVASAVSTKFGFEDLPISRMMTEFARTDPAEFAKIAAGVTSSQSFQTVGFAGNPGEGLGTIGGIIGALFGGGGS